MTTPANPILQAGPTQNFPTPAPAAAPANPTPPAVGDTGGEDLLQGLGGPSVPLPPNIHQELAKGMAKGITMAGNQPGDWAKGTIAGLLGALGGLGAAGKAPPGAGAAYGIGAAARQQAEVARQQKQQQTENAMQERRQGLEEEKTQHEFGIQDQEVAIRQVQAVANMQEHAIRMRTMTDENTRANAQAAREEAEYRANQALEIQKITEGGGKPLTILGQEVPEFDSPKQLHDYALANKQHILGNYEVVPVYDAATGKYTAYETPNQIQDWKIDLGGGKQGDFTGTLGQKVHIDTEVAQLQRDNEMSRLTSQEIAEKAFALGSAKESKSAETDFLAGKTLTPDQETTLRNTYWGQFRDLSAATQKAESELATLTAKMQFQMDPQHPENDPPEIKQAQKNVEQRKHDEDEVYSRLAKLEGFKPAAAVNPPAASAQASDQVFDQAVKVLQGLPPDQALQHIKDQPNIPPDVRQRLIERFQGLANEQAAETIPTGP